MNINNLVFHIHYCNYKHQKSSERFTKKITRTLQHHEIIFVKGGSGSITIENKNYPVKEGMLFYICPNVLHSIEVDTELAGSFFTVHFSYANASCIDNKWEIRNESNILHLHTAQEIKDYYQIEDLFKKLVESWNTKLPGYEFIARTFLQQLLIAIYQSGRKHDRNYSISLKVEKVINYMYSNLDMRLSLTQLAEMVQLSPTYFSRAFREITGYSLIEFFNKLKIDKAKEMIIEGDKKIKEIAHLLGFTDEFYFSRTFKKIEGISPSEYYSKNVHDV
ncbi:MAG: AraC family transcriptional regulator [Bacillota bacterium]|nr:AraC family transcriptional regulator [Bacillota bacterium]